MKILVAVKHVPDTETKIRVDGTGGGLDPAAVTKWIISPYDEYALEQAIRMREAGEDVEVVAVTAGPETAQPTLRQALAMGADRAVLIKHDRFDGVDALVRARALAAVAEAEKASLFLFGKYGVGTDEGLTGPMVGELLGWPHVSAVSSFDTSGESFRAERPVEGAVEVIEGKLPAVVSAEKGLNKPRNTSLKGIMQAKKKTIDVKEPGDLGIDATDLDGEPRLAWTSFELPPPRQAGRLIDGSPEEAARELVRALHEEAKVI